MDNITTIALIAIYGFLGYMFYLIIDARLDTILR